MGRLPEAALVLAHQKLCTRPGFQLRPGLGIMGGHVRLLLSLDVVAVASTAAVSAPTRPAAGLGHRWQCQLAGAGYRDGKAAASWLSGQIVQAQAGTAARRCGGRC